ncbi:TM2 domain-containing protein [Aureibacillus halotolerans]|uniref:TM2 domain-containing protein n=1 Tax=Aureibacillus halotolerans TaxID=1508390 RepID=A0A4R6TXP8_9BACI|nr:TM2 domain-containing protein [Aureibacillus halotolerans]TDQ37143.1 TM2 domain-containing protein [Aureibacillus halotolerans]
MSAKHNLDTRELMLLESEVKNYGKDKVVAYLLWFFVGSIGVHHFYMGRTGVGIGQLLLNITSWILLIFVVGLVGFFALGIWWFVDALLLSGWVDKYNREVEEGIARKIIATRSDKAV